MGGGLATGTVDHRARDASQQDAQPGGGRGYRSHLDRLATTTSSALLFPLDTPRSCAPRASSSVVGPGPRFAFARALFCVASESRATTGLTGSSGGRPVAVSFAAPVITSETPATATSFST